MKNQIEACRAREGWAPAKEILDRIVDNYRAADSGNVPICQDTGMACVFLKVGQEVHVAGDIAGAVNEGVRQGYGEGYLRKSVVRDPLDRVNTGDNTPAMIYYELVPGDRLEITVAPKGFGSENMSQIKMLKPSDGLQGVKDFVVKVVEEAGPNPCPPIVLGVGIGGTFDKAAYLAKRALMRRPLLRAAGGGAPGEDQRPGHRAPGLRRQNNRPGGEYRAVPHPHRGTAGGSEHQLPRDQTYDGGALRCRFPLPHP